MLSLQYLQRALHGRSRQAVAPGYAGELKVVAGFPDHDLERSVPLFAMVQLKMPQIASRKLRHML